jgi:hypothetical protein
LPFVQPFPLYKRKEELMSEHAFDTFSREAAAVLSRRKSLLTLGGAALAAGLAGSVGVEAKQNPVKKAKQKNKKKCNRASQECFAIAQAIAGAQPEAVACCENCFAADFLTCILAVTTTASLQ